MNPRIENNLIYHYTTVNVLNEIIKPDGGLYATHGSFLNDLKEFQAIVDMVRRVLPEESPINPKLHNFFVFSFSMSGDDLSQWRSYTPDGGVSIGFSIRDLWDSFEGRTIGYKNDIHIKESDGFRIFMGACKYVENVADVSNLDVRFHHNDVEKTENIYDFLSTVLFWKQKEFRHENEYRIVFSPFLEDGARQIKQIGNKPRSAIPFRQGHYVNDSIRRIVISPHGNGERIANNVRALFLSYKVPKDVCVEHSKIPYIADEKQGAS